MSSSHHFSGLNHYKQAFIDLAKGKNPFQGRGKKPANKEVLEEIDKITRCNQAKTAAKSVFRKEKTPWVCTCAWHTLAGESLSRSAEELPEHDLERAPDPGPTPSFNSQTHKGNTLDAQSLNQDQSGRADHDHDRDGDARPGTSVDTGLRVVVASTAPRGVAYKTDKSPKVLDITSFPRLTRKEIKGIDIGWVEKPNQLKLFVWAPRDGNCPKCIKTNGTGTLFLHQETRVKIVYAHPWPYAVQGVLWRCTQMHGDEKDEKRWFYFNSYDENYVATLPFKTQSKLPFLMRGASNGLDLKLVRMLRDRPLSHVREYLEAEIWSSYMAIKREFIESREKRAALQMPNTCSVEEFPVFPEKFVPGSKFLVSMCITDYDLNRSALRRELKAVVSRFGVAIDHQRQVIKRVRAKSVLGEGGQTMTAVGDHGVVLGVYAVPDTSCEWLEPAMLEIMSRHTEFKPHTLFVDSGCCNGKPGGTFGFAGRRFKELFLRVQLDGMHLLMRLSREVNAEHPRRAVLLKDLSLALYQMHPGDFEMLMSARKTAGLYGFPPRVERCKFVRKVIGDPEETAQRLLEVVRKHAEADRQAKEALVLAGQKTYGLSPCDVGFPLISKGFMTTFRNQLVHVRNGCCSDDLERPPYIAIKQVRYRNTDFVLTEYRSLRGTSKVETTHAVMGRFFYSYNNITQIMYDAKLSWWISKYNRTRLSAAGLQQPPSMLSPREVELMRMADAGFVEWPEYRLAADPCEDLLIGFEYARKVTDSLDSDDQCRMSTITDESDINDKVMAELDDLEGLLRTGCGEDGTARGTGAEYGSDVSDVEQPEEEIEPPMESQAAQVTEDASEIQAASSEPKNPLNGVHVSKEDEEELFKGVPTGRRRNVSKKQAITGAAGSVSPNFNEAMEKKWKELMLEASGLATPAAVKHCIKKYNAFMYGELSKARVENLPAPPLFPVSHGLADAWLREQANVFRGAQREGAFNPQVVQDHQTLSHNLHTPSASAREMFKVPPVESQPATIPLAVDPGPEPIKHGRFIITHNSKRAPRRKDTSTSPSLVQRPPVAPSAAGFRALNTLPAMKKPSTPKLVAQNPTVAASPAFHHLPHPGASQNPEDPTKHVEKSRIQDIDTSGAISSAAMKKPAPVTQSPAAMPSSSRPKPVPRRRDATEDPEKTRRQKVAAAVLKELGIDADKLEAGDKKRKCSDCWLPILGGHEHKGETHTFCGRGKLFCPFVDDPADLEKYRRETREKKLAGYRKQNAKKKRRRLDNDPESKAVLDANDGLE